MTERMRNAAMLIAIILAGCTTPRRLDASFDDDAGPEDAGVDATTDAGVDAGPDAGPPDAGPPPCDRGARAACDNNFQCCGGLVCGSNSLGQVCCGNVSAACTDTDGTECCGAYGCATHDGDGRLRCCSYVGGGCNTHDDCCGYHQCGGGTCQ